MAKPRIDSIGIRVEMDEYPDLSWLGEYTDHPSQKDWDRGMVIERRAGSREYKYFVGGSEPDYVERDYERMEAYNRGDWYMTGVIAEAEVSYPMGQRGHRRIERFSSGGLWGIESDSGDYFREVAQEQLHELKKHLKQFGVSLSNFKTLAEEALDDMEY